MSWFAFPVHPCSICQSFPDVVVFGTSEALQQAMLRLLRGAELSPKLLCLALEGLKTWPGGSGGQSTRLGCWLLCVSVRARMDQLRPKDLVNPKLVEELVNATGRCWPWEVKGHFHGENWGISPTTMGINMGINQRDWDLTNMTWDQTLGIAKKNVDLTNKHTDSTSKKGDFCQHNGGFWHLAMVNHGSHWSGYSYGECTWNMML